MISAFKPLTLSCRCLRSPFNATTVMAAYGDLVVETLVVETFTFEGKWRDLTLRTDAFLTILLLVLFVLTLSSPRARLLILHFTACSVCVEGCGDIRIALKGILFENVLVPVPYSGTEIDAVVS